MDDGEVTRSSLMGALSELDSALVELAGLRIRNQFLSGVVESLEKTLANQRSTIARLEGERDLWRSRGEYK